jgi:hypothetical protein
VPVTVVQGIETKVKIGVTVGDSPSDTVTFEFAEGFKITPNIQRRGWTVEQETDVIRFSGGELAAGSCEVFEVSIRAHDAGTFRVRAFQRLGGGQWSEHPPDGDVFLNPDGSSVVVNHEGPANAQFEQIVTVTPRADSAAGAPVLMLVVTTLAVLGGLAVVLTRRRRRQPG